MEDLYVVKKQSNYNVFLLAEESAEKSLRKPKFLHQRFSHKLAEGNICRPKA